MQAETLTPVPDYKPPHTKGEALVEFKVGGSQFLRGLVMGIYSWELSKLMPDYVALYGGTLEDAMNRGVDALRHGLAVYVAAIYHGVTGFPGPVNAAGLSVPMAGFIANALAITDRRRKRAAAELRRSAESKKKEADRHAARKREKKARQKARR